MNDSATAAPHPSGPVDDMMVDGMQVLQTGFALARASQLTMLRLQLALHGSKPHAAMQALDILLDIDVEMESIAARLVGNSLHLAENVALSDFMRFQKTAIATEKHAMTGEYGRSQAGLVTFPHRALRQVASILLGNLWPRTMKWKTGRERLTCVGYQFLLLRWSSQFWGSD